MKSSKLPKEKVEQASFQGSINKSPTGAKKRQHPKRAGCLPVKRDAYSRIIPQHGDSGVDKGRSIDTANRIPSKPEDEKHHSSSKMILQLFPVDENIQMGLEKDGHNPFLELILSSRKKVSSVIKHLFNKWGSSRVAMGELMLFPFNVAAEDLTCCRKWTSSDIDIKAGDVHAALGSPEIFRLSYGWVSFQPNISTTAACNVGKIYGHNTVDSSNTNIDETWASKKLNCGNENELKEMETEQIIPSEPLHQIAMKNQDDTERFDLNRTSKVENDTAETNSSAELFKYEESRVNNSTSVMSLLWSDLSNISIGGLLSEASIQGKVNSEDPRSGSSRLLSQPSATDSLDAFIERLKHFQDSTNGSSDMPSSILDAESTCHWFAFSKQSSSSKGLPTVGQRPFSGLSGENAASGAFKCPKPEVNGQAATGSNNIQEPILPKSDSIACSLGALNNENSLGLSSIRWNDSLGPFDLPLAPRKIIKDDSINIGGIVR